MRKRLDCSLSTPAALIKGSLSYVVYRVVLYSRGNDVTRAIFPARNKGVPLHSVSAFPPTSTTCPLPVPYDRPREEAAAAAGEPRRPHHHRSPVRWSIRPCTTVVLRLGDDVHGVDGCRLRARRPPTVRPAGFRHARPPPGHATLPVVAALSIRTVGGGGVRSLVVVAAAAAAAFDLVDRSAPPHCWRRTYAILSTRCTPRPPRRNGSSH